MKDKIEEFLIGKIEDTFLEEVYYSIWRLFDKFVQFYYRSPKNFVKNTIKYREILKDDFWWDYVYLLKMLKIKLKKDSICYKKYGISTENYKIAEHMDRCVSLLDRLIKDEYCMPEFDDYFKKYNNGKSYLSSKKAKTQEESYKFLSINKRAEEKAESDKNELFEIMKKHLFEWWD